MKILFALILCMALLSSCGEKIVWENPEADYRNCLAENAGDESKCEAEKAAYGMQAEQMLIDSPQDDSTLNYDPGNFSPEEDPWQ